MNSPEIQYCEALKQKIESQFVFYVKPMQFLMHVGKYSDRLITECDRDEIDAKTAAKGDKIGASLLLSRLITRQNWFDCTMQVLRDPALKQDYAAGVLEKIKEEFDKEYLKSFDTSKLAAAEQNQRPIKSDFSLRPQNPSTSSLLSDGLPKENKDEYSSNSRKENDAKQVSDSSSNVVFQLGNTSSGVSEESDFDRRMKALQNIYMNQERPSSNTNTNENYETLGAVGGDCPYMPLKDDTQSYSGASPDPQPPLLPQRTYLDYKMSDEEIEQKIMELVRSDLKKMELEKRDPHRDPMHDFTLEETEAALGSCDGWRGSIKETDIFGLMSPFLRKDPGRYIVWFWAKRKRPAICVIHNNKLKTFTIHKKEEKKENRWFYYIYQSQYTDYCLTSLLKHHIAEGFYTEEKNSSTENDKFVRMTNPV